MVIQSSGNKTQHIIRHFDYFLHLFLTLFKYIDNEVYLGPNYLTINEACYSINPLNGCSLLCLHHIPLVRFGQLFNLHTLHNAIYLCVIGKFAFIPSFTKGNLFVCSPCLLVSHPVKCRMCSVLSPVS